MNDPVTPNKPLRLLIVDDNKDAADTLVLLMQAHGYEVRTFYNGADGLASAATFLPHAAILDLGMPKLDGYEVARQLKHDPQTEKIVLFALSGWADEAHVEKAKLVDFTAYFLKPLPLAKLVAVLKGLENLIDRGIASINYFEDVISAPSAPVAYPPRFDKILRNEEERVTRAL